jgi:hypothetical protein
MTEPTISPAAHERAMAILSMELAKDGRTAHTPEEYATAYAKAESELEAEDAARPREALKRAVANATPTPLGRLVVRAHKMLEEQGLAADWETHHLKGALRLAAIELPRWDFARVADALGLDPQDQDGAVRAVVAACGTDEQPIWHTAELRRAAARATARGSGGLLGLEDHTRAEALLIERGIATRSRSGQLVYDDAALARDRVTAGDAYAEALETVRASEPQTVVADLDEREPGLMHQRDVGVSAFVKAYRGETGALEVRLSLVLRETVEVVAVLAG